MRPRSDDREMIGDIASYVDIGLFGCMAPQSSQHKRDHVKSVKHQIVTTTATVLTRPPRFCQGAPYIFKDILLGMREYFLSVVPTR